MKAAGLVLVPLSIAWIGGGSWYMVQQHVEARTAPRFASPPPEPIRLGPPPAPPPPTEPAPVFAAPAARTLRFAKNTGAFDLSEEDRSWCSAAIAHLGADNSTVVQVFGYTDGDGDEEVNRKLSLARARLVAEQLLAAGIPEDRLRIEGKGAADPVADNLTSKGKAMNRRVELRVVAAP